MPVSPVAVVWVAPVSRLLRLTMASLTTAPLGSDTVPEISPEVSDCGIASGVIRMKMENSPKAHKNFLMEKPPVFRASLRRGPDPGRTDSHGDTPRESPHL